MKYRTNVKHEDSNDQSSVPLNGVNGGPSELYSLAVVERFVCDCLRFWGFKSLYSNLTWEATPKTFDRALKIFLQSISPVAVCVMSHCPSFAKYPPKKKTCLPKLSDTE